MYNFYHECRFYSKRNERLIHCVVLACSCYEACHCNNPETCRQSNSSYFHLSIMLNTRSTKLISGKKNFVRGQQRNMDSAL